MFFLLYCAAIAYTQQTPENAILTYDYKGKRDPMVSIIIRDTGPGIVTPVVPTEIKFTGVGRDSKGNKMAIINGEIMKVGDKLGAWTLEQVYDDYIVVKSLGKEHKLPLYAEGEY